MSLKVPKPFTIALLFGFFLVPLGCEGEALTQSPKTGPSRYWFSSESSPISDLTRVVGHNSSIPLDLWSPPPSARLVGSVSVRPCRGAPHLYFG